MFASLARFSCCPPIVDTLRPGESLRLVVGGAQLPAWYVLPDKEWGALDITRAVYGLVVDAHVRARGLTAEEVAEASFLDEKLTTGDGHLSLFELARKLTQDGRDDPETIASLLAPVYGSASGTVVRLARDRLMAVGLALQNKEKRNVLRRYFKHSRELCYLLDHHPQLLGSCEAELRRQLEEHGRTAAEKRPILPWFLAYRLPPIEPVKPYVRQPYLRKDELELARRWTGIEYQGLVGYLVETVFRTIQRVREYDDPHVGLGMVYFVPRDAIEVVQRLEGKSRRKTGGPGGPASGGAAGSTEGGSGALPRDCPRGMEFASAARAGQDALPGDFAAHLGACPACLAAFTLATLPADEASALREAAIRDPSEACQSAECSVPPVAISSGENPVVVQAKGAPNRLDRATTSVSTVVRAWLATVVPGPTSWVAVGGATVGAAGALAAILANTTLEAQHADVGGDDDRSRHRSIGERWPNPEERNRPTCGVVDPRVDYGRVAAAIPAIVLDAPHEAVSLSEQEAVERVAAASPGLTIVLGGPGAGKSVFAQHVAAMSCSSPDLYVSYLHPSSLAAVTTRSLEEIVYEQDLSGGSLGYDAFRRMMRRSSSLLLLDGFDELKDEEATSLRRRVVQWQAQYPKASVVVFSRPMTGTGPTLGFAQQLVESRTYRIAPLTVAHAHHAAERNRGIDPVRFSQFLQDSGVAQRDATGEHYVYLQSFRAVGAMAALFLETQGGRVSQGRAFEALFTGSIAAVGEPEPKACLVKLLRPLSRTTPIRIDASRCEAVAASHPDVCGAPDTACRNLLDSHFFTHEQGKYRPITPAFESFLASRYGRATSP